MRTIKVHQKRRAMRQEVKNREETFNIKQEGGTTTDLELFSLFPVFPPNCNILKSLCL